MNAGNSTGQTPLHLAIQFQRENIINELLKYEDVDLSRMDDDDLTPLTAAFMSEQYKILALMLMQLKRSKSERDQPFDPNDLLHFVSSNSPDLIVLVVELLNAVGWEIRSDTEHGATMLHSAVKNNDSKTLGVLLAKDESMIAKQANTAGPEGSWQVGDTALHVAARNNAIECMAILNAHGCPPNILNSDKLSALHIAVKHNNLDAVMEIFNASIVHTKVNIQTDDKTTPLHIACLNGFYDIAEYLLNVERANVHCQNTDGWTPLHVAAEGNRVEILRLLMENQGNIDSRAKNTDTPLHVAIDHNNSEAADTLIGLGANVNSRGEKNFSPLHKAAKIGNTEIIKKLIESGARIDHRAENKNAALHTAATNGQEKAVQVLCEFESSSIDIDKSGFNGWNAFHQASIGGHVNCMRILLKAGTKLNCEDDFNFDTALHLAARFGVEESVEFLLDQDHIRVNNLNKENKTALDLCRVKGHDLIERYLLESEARTSEEVENMKKMGAATASQPKTGGTITGIPSKFAK